MTTVEQQFVCPYTLEVNGQKRCFVPVYNWGKGTDENGVYYDVEIIRPPNGRDCKRLLSGKPQDPDCMVASTYVSNQENINKGQVRFLNGQIIPIRNIRES